MWEIKEFKSESSKQKWIEKNQYKYQITEIFINNGFALEVKKLRIIKT